MYTALSGFTIKNPEFRIFMVYPALLFLTAYLTGKMLKVIFEFFEKRLIFYTESANFL